MTLSRYLLCTCWCLSWHFPGSCLVSADNQNEMMQHIGTVCWTGKRHLEWPTSLWIAGKNIGKLWKNILELFVEQVKDIWNDQPAFELLEKNIGKLWKTSYLDILMIFLCFPLFSLEPSPCRVWAASCWLNPHFSQWELLRETFPCTLYIILYTSQNHQPKKMGGWRLRKAQTHILIYYRRKFRSETSDNMDSWKSRGGKSQRGEENKWEDQRRKKMQVREKVGKSRITVFFQRFVAQEGRKVGSLKRRVRSQLARWQMKNCTSLWRKARFQVKMYKAHHVRTTFGSWDVEKVHAVVARSTFPSQNAQSTTCSDHFLTFRCRKSARRCGAKHISKSKSTKRHMYGPLLTVEMCVACARDCAPCPKWAKREGFLAVSTTTTTTIRYATLHYTTVDYITQHSTTLHYTTLHPTTPHYTTLHSTPLQYTTSYTTVPLHYKTLHYTPPHVHYDYTTLHYTPFHFTTRRYTHYTTLHFTTLHYTTLHYITLHDSILHSHYMALTLQLHCTTLTLHWTTLQLHCTTLRYTTLRHTVLHYATLHHTTLHSTPFRSTPRYTSLHYTELTTTTTIALPYITLLSTTLHLYYTTLQLHYTTLHYISTALGLHYTYKLQPRLQQRYFTLHYRLALH